jgi:hypothetical protein
MKEQIKVGKKYRLSVDDTLMPIPLNGKIVTITVDYGDNSYRALFNDEADKDWLHYLSDTVVFRDELKELP